MKDALPRVAAYADDGPVIEVPTRWNPRKVYCRPIDSSGSEKGELYAVKYCYDKLSTAAAISEIICHGLIEAVGFRTLEPSIVTVSEQLAASYRSTGQLKHSILQGEHFGTRYRADFDPADDTLVYESLAHPEEIVMLWVLDCWMVNLDRDNYGNAMLQPASSGLWNLIAADQSDCFLGSASFLDGSYVDRSKSHGAVPHLPGLERVILEKGTGSIHSSVSEIRKSLHFLGDILNRVPNEWWIRTGIDPRSIEPCLTSRSNRFREILRIDHWEGLANATRGGHRLEL